MRLVRHLAAALLMFVCVMTSQSTAVSAVSYDVECAALDLIRFGGQVNYVAFRSLSSSVVESYRRSAAVA